MVGGGVSTSLVWDPLALMRHATVEKSALFTDLLHESRSRLYGYIYALVQNQADAEDLFQETTLCLWQKFEEFEQGTDFGRWATRVKPCRRW